MTKQELICMMATEIWSNSTFLEKTKNDAGELKTLGKSMDWSISAALTIYEKVEESLTHCPN